MDYLDMLKAMDCLSCRQPMHPPILQCTSGHSMCSVCVTSVPYCPVCFVPLRSLVRNLSLEFVSVGLSVPCPNKDSGCGVRTYTPHVAKHAALCPYKTYDCPLSMNPLIDCFWKGFHHEIVSHAKDKHPGQIFDLNKGNKIYYQGFVRNNFYYVSLFHFSDHIFVCHNQFDKEEARYAHVLQYLGSLEKASQFQYEIYISGGDTKKMMTFTRQVHNETENVQSVIRAEDCFIINSIKDTNYLLPDKVLQYTWKVK